MKQSAVEWLVEQIETLIENGYVFFPQFQEDLIEQAKEMEKQQIIDAYDKSYMDRYYYNGKNGVQYYNKTFKNK